MNTRAVLITLLSLCFITIKAQEVVIPYGTTVTCILTDEVTLNDKPGKVLTVKVKENVTINEVVVIAKDAPVYAVIRVNQKPKTNYYTTNEYIGELIIDFFSVKAVDGSEVKLSDCYLQFFAEKNNNWFDKNKKWLPVTGSVKNCETRLKVTIKAP